MKGIAILVVGFTVAGSAIGHAQTVAPMPSMIEAAEAEGARHSQTTGVSSFSMYEDAFGPRDRKCVGADASKSVAVRSGDFVAGPFDRHVLMGPPPNFKRKIWWAPHPEPNNNSILTVRAVKLGAPDVTDNFTFTPARADGRWFFPSLIRFREAGRWLVIVTSGQSWGCFLMDEIVYQP